MHSKTKSTLSGLVAVAAFVLGTTLVGQPVASPAPQAIAQPTPADLAAEGAAARVAAALEAAEAAAESARAGSRRRLHLTMPYFAVGRLLPHGGES